MLLLILLDAPPYKSAKIAELISPVLSGMAFLLSAAAFIFTVIIQLKERKRNIRQTLSVSLSDLARINIELSKLKKDEKESTPETVRIRKNYNSQQGTLASGADFLMNENKKIVTDADCELMAMTFDDLGDIEKAKQYWLSAIKHAPGPTQLLLHRRDYAAFLFNNNKENEGRACFEKALSIELSDSDDDFRYVADTYLVWANLENNFNKPDEFHRLIDNAKSVCENIRHKSKRDEMSRLISQAEGLKPDHVAHKHSKKAA